jgi:hypothetical protein
VKGQCQVAEKTIVLRSLTTVPALVPAQFF